MINTFKLKKNGTEVFVEQKEGWVHATQGGIPVFSAQGEIDNIFDGFVVVQATDGRAAFDLETGMVIAIPDGVSPTFFAKVGTAEQFLVRFSGQYGGRETAIYEATPHDDTPGLTKKIGDMSVYKTISLSHGNRVYETPRGVVIETDKGEKKLTLKNLITASDGVIAIFDSKTDGFYFYNEDGKRLYPHKVRSFDHNDNFIAETEQGTLAIDKRGVWFNSSQFPEGSCPDGDYVIDENGEPIHKDEARQTLKEREHGKQLHIISTPHY